MSENLGLGKLITTIQYRDAIHIAVVPVVSDSMHPVRPGEPIMVTDHGGGELFAEPAPRKQAHGIVDPFLDECPHKGDRFWMYLFPGSITSLRHHWTHPMIPDQKSDVQQGPTVLEVHSRQWIERFAGQIGVDYDHMIQMAKDRSMYVGFECNAEIPDEFWDHYQTVTKEHVPWRERVSFFRCSC